MNHHTHQARTTGSSFHLHQLIKIIHWLMHAHTSSMSQSPTYLTRWVRLALLRAAWILVGLSVAYLLMMLTPA